MNLRIAPLPLLVLASFAVAAPASADVTFHVNSSKDAPDKTAADSKCLATNGKCTLRAAVTEANAEPGVDTIKLPKGKFKLTIPGSGGAEQGDLDVSEAVNVVGRSPGMTKIVQTTRDRLFEMPGGLAASTIKGVTLAGGRGASFGGAIYSSSPLDIEYSHLLRNRVYSADLSGARGGAVYAYPSLVLKRDVVVHNQAVATQGTADGGGVNAFSFGAGNSVKVSRSVIRDNAAKMKAAASDAVGGGLAISGPGTIDRTTISANHASSAGGIFENGDDPETLERSLIADNRALDAGGGLQVSAMVIVNSTITGNRVTTGDDDGGGGIFRFGGNIAVAYSTIAGNSSPTGAGGILSNDPSFNSGSVSLQGVVLGNNGARPDCLTEGFDPAPAIESYGYNVVSDRSCDFSATGDVQHTDPKLKPLGDNGGPTLTMSLRQGSPALGRGANGCPTADQRGHKRPGHHCDAGAFER